MNAPALKATLSSLKHHFTRGLSSTFDKSVVQGLKRQGSRAGPDSIVTLGLSKLVGSVVGKKGKKRIRDVLWKATQKAPLDVDTALGNVAADATKNTPFKNLFKVKEKIPVGTNLERTIDRPSITAPLAKARDIATPLIVGYTAEKGLRRLREGKRE